MKNLTDYILFNFKNKKGGVNTKKIIKLDNVKYLDYLVEITNFLPKNCHLRFRFNYLKYGIDKSPKLCKYCKKLLIDVRKNYCSSACSNKDPEGIDKMKKTWHSKSEEDIKDIQNKRKGTNLKKYGIDIASKLPEVIEKNRKSHFDRWGDYAIKDKSVLEKRNRTFIEKYGGIGMGSKDLYAKVKNTISQKYGVEYFSKTDEWYISCMNTARQKYGKDWVSQVDEINVKQLNGGYSWKIFTMPSGKVLKVQGYEPFVLTKLLTEFEESDIIVGAENIRNCIGTLVYNYENKERRYYPDIYIKSVNRVIEVKSQYTFNKELDKNLLKKECVLKKGIDFKFVIIN